jgi:hypothetical protein
MALHRGRLPKKIEIRGVRELTKDDLEVLREKRTTPVVQKLRDPHHALARYIASGMKINLAAERSGYSYARALVLHADPTFQDLVQVYRGKVNEEWVKAQDDLQRLAVSNMVKAERMLAEKLDDMDEAGETPSIREIVAITADRMDRFGYGKKTTNLNLNVDFAAKLERAIQRSGKTIDATPAEPPQQLRRI